MKRKKFSGIFSAVFAVATVITLASCSQDDEYYEDGLFTRADEMMTRSGEQGGYTPTPPTISTLIPEEGLSRPFTFMFTPTDPVYADSLPTFSSNIDVKMFRTDTSIGVEMIEYSMPLNSVYPSPVVATHINLIETSLVVENVRFEVDSPFLNRYRLRASARILRWHDETDDDWYNDWVQNNFVYQGEVPYTIFY